MNAHCYNFQRNVYGIVKLHLTAEYGVHYYVITKQYYYCRQVVS